MISEADYLASAATSRALYKTLFEDATSMLPPHDPAKTPTLERLMSQLPATELAVKLGVSASIVRVELQRLVNFGWIDRKQHPRHLGAREGLRYHLVADMAARGATSLEGVVSRGVLGIKTQPLPAPASFPQEGRGAKRKWRSTPT